MDKNMENAMLLGLLLRLQREHLGFSRFWVLFYSHITLASSTMITLGRAVVLVTYSDFFGIVD